MLRDASFSPKSPLLPAFRIFPAFRIEARKAFFEDRLKNPRLGLSFQSSKEPAF